MHYGLGWSSIPCIASLKMPQFCWWVWFGVKLNQYKYIMFSPHNALESWLYYLDLYLTVVKSWWCSQTNPIVTSIHILACVESSLPKFMKLCSQVKGNTVTKALHKQEMQEYLILFGISISLLNYGHKIVGKDIFQDWTISKEEKLHH